MDFSSTMKLFLLMSFALFSIISTKEYEIGDVMQVKAFAKNGRTRIYIVFSDIKKTKSIKSCFGDCGETTVPQENLGLRGKPTWDCMEKCIRKYKCSPQVHRNSYYAMTHYFNCYE